MANTSGISCRAPWVGPIPVNYTPKQDNEHPHPFIGKCLIIGLFTSCSTFLKKVAKSCCKNWENLFFNWESFLSVILCKVNLEEIDLSNLNFRVCFVGLLQPELIFLSLLKQTYATTAAAFKGSKELSRSLPEFLAWAWIMNLFFLSFLMARGQWCFSKNCFGFNSLKSPILSFLVVLKIWPISIKLWKLVWISGIWAGEWGGLHSPPPPHHQQQPPATENYEIFRQTANDSGNDTWE